MSSAPNNANELGRQEGEIRAILRNTRDSLLELQTQMNRLTLSLDRLRGPVPEVADAKQPNFLSILT